ncbi:Transmembrane protein 97 [Actinomortierella wolfii]|nr:Transmembrane protein 97 [Actinomortierella wolfii]
MPAAVAKTQRVSLWSRPKDLAMFIFFVTLLPITLGVDMVPLYPESFYPYTKPIQDAFYHYTRTNKDPIMGNLDATTWYKVYIIMKIIIQPPLSVYASILLYRNETRRLALPLVVYSTMLCTMMFPAMCIFLFEHPDRLPHELADWERYRLVLKYSPWFLFSAWMLIENYRRLRREEQLASKAKSK